LPCPNGTCVAKGYRDGSGRRLVGHSGLASRRPERTLAEAGGSEIVHTVGKFVAFDSPGGTPRLYGRQDARRYGKVAQCPNVNRKCDEDTTPERREATTATE